MKTIKIIAAAIATFMVTANVNAENKNTKANASVQVVKVEKSNCRSVVQTSEDGSSLKFDYILNDKGKVVNKVISTWDSNKDEWTPVSAYSVVYTPSETILSYAKYNTYTKTFSQNIQQVRYNAAEYPELIKLPECCK